jgi:hypothetical protein
MSRPIIGTPAETYLRRRGITTLCGTHSLRFHPRCYYRSDPCSPAETWPRSDRCRHRSRRLDHRRTSHLARPVRRRQGADRHTASGDGPSPW